MPFSTFVNDNQDWLENHEKRLAEAIKDNPERELKIYEQAEKLKNLRELTKKRFSPIAWWLVMSVIPETETSTDNIVELVCADAREIWGDNYKESLEIIGLKTAKDVGDMLSLAHEHGIVKGENTPYYNDRDLC